MNDSIMHGEDGNSIVDRLNEMNLTDKSILNIWGGGQLLAFSGFDGDTDCERELLLRSVADIAAFEVKLPQTGGLLVADLSPPVACFIAGDHFELELRSGEKVRGAFLDAYHVLILGKVSVSGLSDAVRIKRRQGRMLLGVSSNFNETLISADFEAAWCARRKWLENITPPAGLSDTELGAFYKACSMMKGQLRSPVGNFRCRWTTPDRWPHRWLWLWDSVFHAIGLRHIAPDAAKEALSAIFAAQRPDGFVPHMTTPDSSTSITQPPIIALGIKMVLEKTDDTGWLRDMYSKNKRFLEWIMANRDSDGAGLVEWAIDTHANCRSGESGMDNSPRFDSATQLDAPDLNAFLSSDCESMAELAHRLKLNEDTEFWQKHHDRLNSLINDRLWDDNAGLYVDYDVKTNKRSTVLSSAGFLPLLSGTASPEQTVRLAAQLQNPSTFGTPLQIPSISCGQPEFYSKDMWRGPVWININYLVALGFERCGYSYLAEKLRATTCAEIEKFYLKYGTFFEFYDDRCECDPPQLLRKGSNDIDISPYHQPLSDYGWSATLYIDMLFSKKQSSVIGCKE